MADSVKQPRSSWQIALAIFVLLILSVSLVVIWQAVNSSDSFANGRFNNIRDIANIYRSVQSTGNSTPAPGLVEPVDTPTPSAQPTATSVSTVSPAASLTSASPVPTVSPTAKSTPTPVTHSTPIPTTITSTAVPLSAVAPTPKPVPVGALGIQSQDSNSIVITWTTDTTAPTRLDFGTTTSYGQSIEIPGFSTQHRAILQGLQANTVYHYQVVGDAVDKTLVTGSGSLGTTTILTSSVLTKVTIGSTDYPTIAGHEYRVNAPFAEGASFLISGKTDKTSTWLEVIINSQRRLEEITSDPTTGNWQYQVNTSGLESGTHSISVALLDDKSQLVEQRLLDFTVLQGYNSALTSPIRGGQASQQFNILLYIVGALFVIDCIILLRMLVSVRRHQKMSI